MDGVVTSGLIDVSLVIEESWRVVDSGAASLALVLEDCSVLVVVDGKVWPSVGDSVVTSWSFFDEVTDDFWSSFVEYAELTTDSVLVSVTVDGGSDLSLELSLATCVDKDVAA